LEFDKLYLELVDSSGMIRALLAGISQEDAQIRPKPGSWSILETLCHLYDEEREDFREHLDFILHRGQGQWHRIDPEAWVAARKYNQQSLAEMKEKFFSERSRSLDWLKGQEGADWELGFTSDYGKLTAGDMLASWVAHDNLSIRQLIELRRARLEKLVQPHSLAYAGDW
jgi:hypothetical protein